MVPSGDQTGPPPAPCLRLVTARASPPSTGMRWIWGFSPRSERKAISPPSGENLGSESTDHACFPEELLVDDSPSPRHRAQQVEQCERLWRALDQLDEGQRDVVILKGIHELACQEVAQILGIGEGTVWSRFHRALTRLRALLGPEGEEL